VTVSRGQQPTAAQLVARAQQGDDRAFGELVRRYRQRIVALTLHLTGSASDAEDITQEVFLGAYRALRSFEGRSHFFTWLYRLAVNRALNAQRSRSRRRESFLEEDPRIDKAIAVDAAGDPQRAAELRELYARLLVALDRLPAPVRTSVVLVTLQGMSHAEAAVIQTCAPGTVAWRIHEARKQLRIALDAPNKIAAATQPASALSRGFRRLLAECGLPVPSEA
jgi:RNA polymerase sigma-70 factor, ECF subfamily